MAIAASYRSSVVAHQAAEWLIQHGIAARVVGGTDALSGASGAFGVIVERHIEPAAKELLLEWERLPPLKPEEWEASSLPDLCLLDPSIKAPCPACGVPLPLDAAVRQCPRCTAPVDVVEIIVNCHGPEALDACFADDPAAVDDELLAQMDLRCPGCEYSLKGLAHTGVCPECGRRYSKHQLIRGDPGQP